VERAGGQRAEDLTRCGLEPKLHKRRSFVQSGEKKLWVKGAAVTVPGDERGTIESGARSVREVGILVGGGKHIASSENDKTRRSIRQSGQNEQIRLEE